MGPARPWFIGLLLRPGLASLHKANPCFSTGEKLTQDQCFHDLHAYEAALFNASFATR
jgi:hypothetical protein